MKPDENHISIYFRTINFNNIKDDKYYYLLEGIDNDWIGPTEKNYVVYPYLNPGNYKFKVKSKNIHTGLYSNEADFSFIILTPWYNQIWFFVLIVLAILGLLTLTFVLRLNIIRKKSKEKMDIMIKISDLEYKALQAQMNPHFLFNSINSIQNFILDNNVDEALVYLNSFSRVIRQTLDFVNKKFISLSEEIEYLNHYVKLENMRFDNLFTFEVICDEAVDCETTLIPPMLLQTIVENSIKHGIMHLKQKGKIILEIRKIDSSCFKCIIQDNGIGRIAAAKIYDAQKIKRESRGLKISKDRVALLNNGTKGCFNFEIIDLYDDGDACGTRVEITFAFQLG